MNLLGAVTKGRLVREATWAAPASPKPGETGRFDATSRTDDSYEAALRAADALFAPQKDRRSAEVDGQGTDTDGVRESAGRGRILRVLDEPSPEPTSGMMDEAERDHAPKRRGRKPGSKNRPKADKAASPDAVLPIDARTFDGQARHVPSSVEPSDRDRPTIEPVASFGAGVASGDTVAREPSDGGHGDGHRDDGGSIAEDLAEDTVGRADPAADRSPRAGQPSRERRRFSWVRTTLKPGQEWKRRLPKVCW